MSAPPLPPLPPRPYDANSSDKNGPLPPPVPPLPPDLRTQAARYNTPSKYELVDSPPHFENPLIAPRPHRLDPSIPANMARKLDDQLTQQPPQQQLYQQIAQPPPAPPPPPSASFNYTGGYNNSLPTPGPGPNASTNWSPWGPQIGGGSSSAYPNVADVSRSIANLSLVSSPMPVSAPSAPPMSAPPPSQQFSRPGPQPSTTSPQPSIQSLTAPLPQLPQLESATNVVQQPNHDPNLKIAWCRDIFFLIERQRHESITPSTDPIVGPVHIADPALARLAPIAVQMTLQLAGSQTPAPPGVKLPPYVSEAIFIRATLAASGAFPEYVKHNPRIAFRDFEASARGGHPPAWFRLGRDYENFNDHAHAKECFERGVKLGVESCLYRMGMAHLLGQLSLPQNPTIALPLLHRAATLASIEVPQPAYVYALLLLAEFRQITLPPTLFSPFVPPNSSPTLEARKHLERAAYLHFAAAQYKLGHAYEFAEPPLPFDPLLSVQYYSLASQQGELEADMALSKWFLCGSGGAAIAGGGPSGDPNLGGFEKDEALALTFAEKAANKGLPSAEFAMGYYAEVGVGRPKDVNEAISWYQKASEHGNTDASARLSALSAPSAQALSRQEHDSITENKLVRRRTLAAQRAETQPLSPPWEGQTFPTVKQHQQQQQQGPRRGGDGRNVVDVIRKNSVLSRPQAVTEQQQPNSQQQSQYQWGSAGTNSPQRTASPAGGGGGGRRGESPGRQGGIPAPQGGRPPSPGRNRINNNNNNNRVDYNSTPPIPPTNNVNAGAGATGSLGRVGGKLNRLRLNLDDSAPQPTPQPQPASQSNTSLTSSTSTPAPAPAPSRPTPSHANSSGGGGKRPQTFAEMGIQGVKAEKDDCVIM